MDNSCKTTRKSHRDRLTKTPKPDAEENKNRMSKQSLATHDISADLSIIQERQLSTQPSTQGHVSSQDMETEDLGTMDIGDQVTPGSLNMTDSTEQVSGYQRSILAERKFQDVRSDGRRSELEVAQITIRQLQAICQTMGAERNQMATDLRRLQQRAFQSFEDPDWKPDCNADIERKLAMLDAEVKRWSKLNSIRGWHSLQLATDPTYQSKLAKTIREFANMTAPLSPTGIPDDKVWMLVQAYIMHTIYLDIFEHPFFGVQPTPVQTVHSKTPHEQSYDAKYFTESLQFLYDDFMDCNRSDAVAWRVQTLRQLLPRVSEGKADEKVHSLRQETIKSRDQAVRVLVSQYKSSYICPLLLDQGDESIWETLSAILSKAAAISYSLWTQKIHLSPETLEGKKIPQTFRHDHGLIAAHQLHAWELEEDLRRLDDKPVLLMTHPALLQSSYEGTAGLETVTVLRKGICWMGQGSAD